MLVKVIQKVMILADGLTLMSSCLNSGMVSMTVLGDANPDLWGYNNMSCH